MQLLVIRHGESTANIAGILSSSPSDDVPLTTKGARQAKEAAGRIVGGVAGLYVSPLQRTLETAGIITVAIDYGANIIIDDRIREIDYGSYSGKANDTTLDAIRALQVNGDYEVRFGSYGENKREISLRIYDFLIEIAEKYATNDQVVAVSHGSIASWIDRTILSLGSVDSEHRHVDNGDVRLYMLNPQDGLELRKQKADALHADFY